MNYEAHMRSAIAAAEDAALHGELADGAVAILDEALVATARDGVATSGDPTAHAVIGVIRAAARRLGRRSLAGVTVFSVAEPCAMCVGALLAADADGVVFAIPDPRAGACAGALQLPVPPGRVRGLRIVSGILRDRAAELRPDLDDRPATRPRAAS